MMCAHLFKDSLLLPTDHMCHDGPTVAVKRPAARTRILLEAIHRRLGCRDQTALHRMIAEQK